MSHTQEQGQGQIQESGQTGTEQPGKPKRVLYPYGSASPERDDAIAVLGALKVATATQIMRLVRPHLSDNKSFRNALLDLAKHGLVVSEGNSAGPRGRIGTPGRSGPAAQKLWRLTAAGLDWADQIMEEGVDGGLARGVARGGAKHAMAVNATVTAFVRGGTTPGAAAGICGSGAFRTETHLPIASGSEAAVRVDAVLRAPEAGVPAAMIEVDRGTESPERVAEKLARYETYFARPVHDGNRRNSIAMMGGAGEAALADALPAHRPHRYPAGRHRYHRPVPQRPGRAHQPRHGPGQGALVVQLRRVEPRARRRAAAGGDAGRPHRTLSLPGREPAILKTVDRPLTRGFRRLPGRKSANLPASTGGHVDAGETSRAAAVRELAEETGVHVTAADLRQIGVWDQPGRDPRGRYVTVVYLAVVPAGTPITAGDDARTARWWALDDLPPQLAFDHGAILGTAVKSTSARRREVVVLCGSTRFWTMMAKANLRETAAGHHPDSTDSDDVSGCHMETS